MLGKKKNTIAVFAKEKYGLLKDGVLKKTISDLKQSKEELNQLNDYVKKWCDLPNDKKRHAIAKICCALVPRRAYNVLPQPFVKFMAEENDVLVMIERLMRGNVNNIQEALRDLAICAIQKKEMIEELENDLETAVKENWDAQKLQDYIAEKADIEVYDEVSRLLDSEFNAISPKEKEKRKEDLLTQLRANIKLGDQFMETLGRVCSAGIDVFHQGVGQYYNYKNFQEPISVIRDAAKTLVDMNTSMYASKDALKATFLVSLKAIETAVEAANMVEKYSIVSSDMQDLLKSGRSRLEEKLKALEGLKEKNKRICKASIVEPTEDEKVVEVAAEVV